MENVTIRGYVEYRTPFCSPFLCHKPGINQGGKFNNVSEGIALWECMPDACRQKLNGFLVVVATLAVFTTIFNAIMIVINCTPDTRRMLRRNPTMQNYSTYVISLACADLLMGAVVLPLIALYFYMEIVTVRKSSFVEEWIITKVVRENVPSQVIMGRFKEVFATANTNQEISSIDIPATMNLLTTCLGTVFLITLIVSLYTIAAASADRFYVSTKAVTNRSISLSSSSFRRSSSFVQSERCCTQNVNRSTFVVIFIWIAAISVSVAGAITHGNHFHTVGHVFVIPSVSEEYATDLQWYFIAFSIPLALTWVFSVLLYVTLWKRKSKFKNSSKTYSQKCAKRNRRKTDLDQEISVAHTSRYSNTETPVVTEPMMYNSSDPTTQRGSKLSETLSNTEGTEKCTNNRTSPTSNFLQLSLNIAEAARPDFGNKKRPNSFDSSFRIPNFYQQASENNNNQLNKNNEQEAVLLIQPRSYVMKSSLNEINKAAEGPPAGYVAKRILCRRSWSGYSSETDFKPDSIKQVSKPSPKLPRRWQSLKTATTPSTPITSSGLDRKCDTTRHSRSTTRVRRKSSIFRARELIRPNSYESNIAKTLLAVVVTFSFAIVPFLIISSQISTTPENKTMSKINGEVSALTVVLTILISNSFWNCFIYGARMPYFRPAIIRVFRKLTGNQTGPSCCRIMRRKLSLTSSSIRKETTNRPSSLFWHPSQHI
ncbi:uncharacterized protein LOC143447509 [Clavelina lepadiformis]|uniref:G-protein coupled receptors family 1 profile domain-containing protein n=1 Tax=Clavelina lepadiformis TaxID=159417 RepID=A0ABP0GTJ5_CLALP